MRHSTARCTCCHTCHASEKTSSRTFVPCTTCNSINCRPCLELCGEDWDQVLQNSNWSCPKCLGICPCQRCRNKIHHVSDVTGDKPKHIITLPISLKPKKKKRKFSTLIPHKKVRTPTHDDDDFCFSSSVSAPSVKRMRCSSTGASVIGIPDVLLESSSSRSPSPSSSDIETDSERLLDCDTIDCLDTLERKRLTDLIDRNKRCSNFIEQTEHLLRLIRAEQHNIVNQLKLFQKVKSSASPSAKLPDIPPPSSPLSMPTAPVVISTSV